MTTICFTLDDVIRAKTAQFGKIYKKYIDNSIDLDNIDIESGDLCEIFFDGNEREYRKFIYEDYPFEITQNITLERLNKYILENKFKDWEEFCKSLTNRRSVVGKIHRESWKDKLTYYSEEQDLQEQQ